MCVALVLPLNRGHDIWRDWPQVIGTGLVVRCAVCYRKPPMSPMQIKDRSEYGATE